MYRFKKSIFIKQIRNNLENGCLINVAYRKAGIRSSWTLSTWVTKDKSGRLRLLVNAALARGQANRDEIVEDAHYRRLAEGKAGGHEYEFYLTNRKPERWKKTTEYLSGPSALPAAPQRPVINYISVHAENATLTVAAATAEGNGHDNGEHGDNGNGKPRISDHV